MNCNIDTRPKLPVSRVASRSASRALGSKCTVYWVPVPWISSSLHEMKLFYIEAELLLYVYYILDTVPTRVNLSISTLRVSTIWIPRRYTQVMQFARLRRRCDITIAHHFWWISIFFLNRFSMLACCMQILYACALLFVCFAWIIN